jgi:hypothetical protein
MVSKKLQLKDVTCIAVDCYNYGKAIHALQKSMEQVDFGAVKFLTDINIKVEGIEVVEIPRIDSKEEYSEFIVKGLYPHFETSHVLVIQHDGYVLDASAWTDEFLKYDYIGAPWLYVDGRNVGNGGFSLRSRRLQDVLRDYCFDVTHPEDEIIGRLYRKFLEQRYAMFFAPQELAEQFAFELRQPNQKTFGFHGNFHKPYKPYVVLKRSGALGDCVLMEPVVRWYCEQRWNVVLDIPASFWDLFVNYEYGVLHISHLDKGRIKPEKEINLDMAYEVYQDRPFLQCYFDMCGITDYKLTKPQLWPFTKPENRLFRSYAVLHIDERDTVERNTSGVNWELIKKVLQNKGIDLIQIGVGKHDEYGLWVNTQSVGMMAYVIAGASLFIGVDSGPSHLAIAKNVPAVLLFGSTDADKIHVDTSDVYVVQGDCDKKGCWHVKGGTAGQKCLYIGTENEYQCTRHKTAEVLDAIDKILNKEA